MYKKLIENSLDILYDKLQESRDKQLVVGVSEYLMLAVYKMFRQMYEASPKNISGMFRVGSARWNSGADAAMHMAEGDLAWLGFKVVFDPAAAQANTDNEVTKKYGDTGSADGAILSMKPEELLQLLGEEA